MFLCCSLIRAFVLFFSRIVRAIWKGNQAAKSKNTWMLNTVTLILQWRHQNWFNKLQRDRTSVFASRCSENDCHGGYRDKNPRSRVGRSSIEGVRDCWDSRHLKRPCGSYPAWNFGHKKAVSTMDDVFLTQDNTRNRETTSDRMLPIGTSAKSFCF